MKYRALVLIDRLPVLTNPVVVEAMKYDGLIATALAIQAWSDGAVYVGTQGALDVDTRNGTATANVGDWIIKGINGEFYPCKPDIFEATYERVDDER